MKRVGELFEVVVFTASVSKVRLCLLTDLWAFTNLVSMVILCWINWTFTMSSIIGYSETVATTTKGTMSRLVDRPLLLPAL